MNIGSLKLKNPFFLAPMHQINDIAFRILCEKNGCGLTYTWLLHPLSREKLMLEDRPAIQIATSSEKGVSEFIEKHEKNAKLFDLNLGCPACNAREQDYGAYLQRHPERIEQILEKMRSSTDLPITVKLRKSKGLLSMMGLFNRHCDAIAIHPRTAEQGYSGIPDIKFAEKVKKLTHLPVIYSGDVDEKNFPEFLEKFDYVMIGRKAIGNPSIFSKLTGQKAIKSGFDEYLKLSKRYKLDFSQIKFQAMQFTKGKENAGRMRVEISKAQSIEQLKGMF